MGKEMVMGLLPLLDVFSKPHRIKKSCIIPFNYDLTVRYAKHRGLKFLYITKKTGELVKTLFMKVFLLRSY